MRFNRMMLASNFWTVHAPEVPEAHFGVLQEAEDVAHSPVNPPAFGGDANVVGLSCGRLLLGRASRGWRRRAFRGF